MIAPGNHNHFDSLRGAPPHRPASDDAHTKIRGDRRSQEGALQYTLLQNGVIASQFANWRGNLQRFSPTTGGLPRSLRSLAMTGKSGRLWRAVRESPCEKDATPM